MRRLGPFLILLRVVATLGLGALLLWKVDLGDVGRSLAGLSLGDVATLLVITVAQVSVSVIRWWRVFRYLGERPPWLALYGDTVVGILYNQLLPSSLGGDAVRAIRSGRRVRARHVGWSTTLYERVAGLLALAATGAISVPIALARDARLPIEIQATIVGVALVLLLGFLFASRPFRLGIRAVERRLPRLADDLRGIAADLDGELATTAARLETVGWSLLYQALGIAFVVFGAHALGSGGHATAIVIGMPIIHVLSIAPITVGGLGLRESLFVSVLGRLGVDPAIALGLATQWLAANLVFALAGVTVALTAPRPASAPPAAPGAPA